MGSSGIKADLDKAQAEIDNAKADLRAHEAPPMRHLNPLISVLAASRANGRKSDPEWQQARKKIIDRINEAIDRKKEAIKKLDNPEFQSIESSDDKEKEAASSED